MKLYYTLGMRIVCKYTQKKLSIDLYSYLKWMPGKITKENTYRSVFITRHENLGQKHNKKEYLYKL